MLRYHHTGKQNKVATYFYILALWKIVLEVIPIKKIDIRIRTIVLIS